ALTKGLLNRFTHSIDGTLGRPKGIQRTLATLKRCGHPSDRLADDKDGVGAACTGAVFAVKNPSRFIRNSATSNRLSIREEEDARIERDGASKHKTSPAYRGRVRAEATWPESSTAISAYSDDTGVRPPRKLAGGSATQQRQRRLGRTGHLARSCRLRRRSRLR